MNKLNAWVIGLVLIVGFILAGEFVTIFRDYFFYRLGLNRNLVLGMLWLVPVLAAFVAVSFSPTKQLLLGGSYVPILSFLGPLAHLIFGLSGAKVDFSGVEGLKVTFQIFFLLSLVTVGIGCIAGIVFRTRRSNSCN
jgi:hypothetical protein